jgi:hypothetical protein
MGAEVVSATIRARNGSRGARLAAVRIASILLGVAAAVACGVLLYKAPDGSIDFRTGVWQPAFDIAHSRTPYPPADTWRSQDGTPSIYPPFIAVMALPLGLLPFAVASVIWSALLMCTLALTLRAVGVRDWRIFGAAILSLPVFVALELGQVEILLVLATALLWRYRDTWLLAALALGLGLAIKPLMFPLLAWLLITRRVRALGASLAVAGAVTLASWAVIGFAGLRAYPALLQAWDRAYGACGVSVSAFALKLGAPGLLATSLRLAAAAALLTWAWRLARRPEGDRASFACAIGALVAAAPVFWGHYLVYFLVPIALAAPRLDRRWLLLAVPWVLGSDDSLRMHLVHVGARVVPTTSFVGSNGYGVFVGYLLLSLAIVVFTARVRRDQAVTPAA